MKPILRSVTWSVLLSQLGALLAPALAQTAVLAPPPLTAAPMVTAVPVATAVPASTLQQVKLVAQQAAPVVQAVNPQLGTELKVLNGQVQKLVTNVHAVEQNIHNVSSSAKTMGEVVKSYPNQLEAYRARYGVPQNASLQQEIEGAGRFAREKLNISPEKAAQVSRAIKSTPIYEQLRTPFEPANILMAVGATAGINILSQIGSEDGLDLNKALGFVGEGSFWGGMLGSGLGYGLMASVATALIPGGAGLVGVLTPMFAGMTGSIFGFEIGSNLAKGDSLGDAVGKLSPATILGQAGGSTVGLLVGSQVGAMIGGTLGAVAGPLGAVAGAVLLGRVGANIGNAVKSLFQGDEEPLQEAVGGAEAVLTKLEKTGKTLEKAGSILGQLIPGALPAASMDGDGLPAKLQQEYSTTYQELTESLKKGDRARAHLQIQYLQKIEARYHQAIEGSTR